MADKSKVTMDLDKFLELVRACHLLSRVTGKSFDQSASFIFENMLIEPKEKT